MSKSSSYNKPPIHPNVWRASQLAQAQGRYIDTGYKALSQQLPGKGWPLGQLINVLVQQPGVGELQLVLPALSHLNQGPIVLLNPGYQPQIAAWVQHGLAPSQLLWVAAPNSSNALWAAIQILR
ncbi:MAG TPA: cell division protein, partial [Burkholderiaceae bacterium]|nr:cell division protein [Burkholderiaceae bacterium]